MKIRSSLFGGLISGGGRWELAFDQQSIVYANGGQPVTGIPLGTITHASAKPGLFWSTIEIVAPDQRIVAKGSLNRAAEDFVGPLCVAIGRALLSEMERLSPALLQFANTCRKLLEHPRYISHYDVEARKKAIPAADHAVLIRMLALVRNPLIPPEGTPPEARRQLDLLVDVLSGPRSQVKIRNEQFVAGEVTRFKDFFDRVEPTPLTAEQRTASVVLEDCNLLVAAAGSGKTSTVVGKVGYKLLTKQYDPRDFLVLAFNNDAAKELDVRINENLRPWVSGGERVKATTFHALGLEIITAAVQKKQTLLGRVRQQRLSL